MTCEYCPSIRDIFKFLIAGAVVAELCPACALRLGREYAVERLDKELAPAV